MSEARELLLLARGYLLQGWVQHCEARTAADRTCWADDPLAVAWCASGAVSRALTHFPGEKEGLSGIEGRAIGLLFAACGGGIIPYNDRPEATKAEIIAAFDRAIDRSQNEGTP